MFNKYLLLERRAKEHTEKEGEERGRRIQNFKNINEGILWAQWLVLRPSTARSLSSILVQGTKISHTYLATKQTNKKAKPTKQTPNSFTPSPLLFPKDSFFPVRIFIVSLGILFHLFQNNFAMISFEHLEA